MNKVCIVSPSSISYTPYLHLYLNLLRKNNVECDIVYWDRFNLKESINNSFSFNSEVSGGKFSTLKGYWGFRQFLINHFSKNKYDKYIILSAQMGVILFDFLLDKNFVLDIRDYSHERIYFFNFFEKILIKKSKMVFISSKGFEDWLPKEKKYVVSHNCSNADYEFMRFDFNKKNISYIGSISYHDVNIDFIEKMKNKEYVINYIGKGDSSNIVESYVFNKNINNVKFMGRFLASEKKYFYEDANFILSAYGNNSLLLTTSIPNRLYDACKYGRPIIVSNNTYLAKIVEDFDIGIIWDGSEESLVNKLSKYYDNNVYLDFLKNCEIFLSMVSQDNHIFENKFTSWIFG